MKKILLILLFIPVAVFAKDKDTVSFYKCVDGDTAKFILNKKEITVRFIGIDAPESVKPNEEPEPYGKKASNYTCNRLKKANKIYLEYDPKTKKKDKYDRYLAYVFVDDKLLQELIVKNGYAEVKYIKKDYKYYDKLEEAEDIAKNKKVGIYSGEKEDNTEITKSDLEKNITKYATKYFKKIFSSILREILK